MQGSQQARPVSRLEDSIEHSRDDYNTLSPQRVSDHSDHTPEQHLILHDASVALVSMEGHRCYFMRSRCEVSFFFRASFSKEQAKDSYHWLLVRF